MKEFSNYGMVFFLVQYVTGCSDPIFSPEFVNNATFIKSLLSLRLSANAMGGTLFDQELTLINYFPVAEESSGYTVVYEYSNSPPGYINCFY